VTLIELLVALGVIGLLLAMLLPAIQSSRAAARKTYCQNNLRQIGIAAHGFHDQHGFLSTWEFAVSLLPQLEQSKLAELISLARNPDHRLSKEEWAQIQTPSTFICPSDTLASPPQRHSSYAVNMGLTLEANRGFHSSKGIGERRFSEFSDGLSHSALLAEKLILLPDVELVEPHIARTHPLRYYWEHDRVFFPGEDHELVEYCLAEGTKASARQGRFRGYFFYTGDQPVYQHSLPPGNWSFHGKQLGPITASSLHLPGAHVLFADGHVSLVSQSIDYRVFWALGTISGGETQD
jgi:prepilin-type processing-associated H-X9-DG protein